MNNEMMEKIAAYAVRTGKTEDEAKVAFAAWLKDEFGVVDMATEDEYLLNEWAEMFVIETRNLGASGGGGRENVRSTASASILTRRGWAGVERRGCVRLEGRPSAVGDGARVRNTCARLPVAKGGKPVSDGCRYWRSLPRRWGDRQLVRSLRRQVSTRSGRPMSGTSAGGSKAYVGASSRGRRDCARFVRTARCRRSVAKGGAGVAGR